MPGPVDVQTDNDVFMPVELGDVGAEVCRFRMREGNDADLLRVRSECQEGLFWEEVTEVDDFVVGTGDALQFWQWCN